MGARPSRERSVVARGLLIQSLVVALTGCFVLGACGGGSAADGGSSAVAAAAHANLRPPDTGQVRAVDPCTLLTNAEVRTLLTATAARRVPGGDSLSTCTISATGGRTSVRVALYGGPDTAPDVFRDRMSFGQEPDLVAGVGRAAFAVYRPDEVGLVVLTSKAVLSVSLLATSGFPNPHADLVRMTPVVKQVATRL